MTASTPDHKRPSAAEREDLAPLVLATIEQLVRELHVGDVAPRTAQLDSSLDVDFALDSLARVELGSRLEAASGVTLSESVLFEAETPRDLLRGLLRASGTAPLRFAAPVAPVPDAEASAAPDTVETLPGVLEWHVRQHGDRAHIQFYDDYTEGEVLTYRDLYAGASRVAGALQARGLEPGEQVALMLPTSRDYFFAFFGVVLAGGVPVPIYPPVRRAQLEDHLRRQSRILTNCRAAMLITSGDASRIAHLLGAAVASLRHVVTVVELASGDGKYEPVTRSRSDTAFLQYTSGSTGDPKGVILTHANLLANMRGDGHAMAATPQDVFVSWLPLYHDMGLIGAWFGSLYHAVRLVVMPPLTFLAKPARWLWAIHRYGGTLSAAPNFAFELCLKRIADAEIEGLDLRRWRVAANGAEAISARTLDAFCERFGAYGFRREAMMPVYGLAECTVGLTFPPLGRGPVIDVVQRDVLTRSGRAEPVGAGAAAHDALRLVACGRPLPRHEIRVVDRAGRELPDRHEGRLQFRGPSATSGYFDRPEETMKLLQNGWLETGDRAYIAGGDLYITGRIKDIIIRAGRNIYPEELEDAIGNLEGVRKGHVAVFGSNDPATETERVIVLAETRRRDEASRQVIRSAINTLATDLIATPPDEVVLVEPNTVLRTSSGKIRRAACRGLYEQQKLGSSSRALWLQVVRLALAGVLPQIIRGVRALSASVYAVYAWAVFVVFALAAWLVTWMPMPGGLLWRIERAIVRTLAFATGTRITLSGEAGLPPAGTACVVVSNHQSYLDGMLLLGVLPRPPRFLAKGELRQSRTLALPLTRLGTLFVERFDAAGSIAGLRDSMSVLETGAMLVIFPEGTFKRMPGVLPFHMGAFSAAAEAHVPIVPIAVRGTRSILRAGTWMPRRGVIEVHIGQAVHRPEGVGGWSAAIALRDAARRHILDHCGEPDLAHESNVVEPP